MSFLNPIALWGLLAIGIPVMIHLWNGKRGKILAWAAMDFLKEVDHRVSKGIKLENWLVLLLRVLLIVLLVLLLAQLFIPKDRPVFDRNVVHLLSPEIQIREEFRFEISQAIEKGESVYLAVDPIEEINSLEEIFNFDSGKSLELQAALDQLPSNLDSLVLYLPNSNQTLSGKFYTTSVSPQIFLSSFNPIQTDSPLIQVASNQFFGRNEKGLLDSVEISSEQKSRWNYAEKPVLYFIKNPEAERQYIIAALEAIRETYGLDLLESEDFENADLVFTDMESVEPEAEKLYFQTNKLAFQDSPNHFIFSENLTFQQSEVVKNGSLPELILEKWLDHIGFPAQDVAINPSQLRPRFLRKSNFQNPQQANRNEWLFLALLATLALERFYSSKQGI